MNISKKTAVNFIHIPKNGGTSIEKMKCPMIRHGYHGRPIENLKNQLIIIRNPIDRFISAVYHCLEKASHLPQVKALIDKGITTPDKWLEIWRNLNHPDYLVLMDEVKNKSGKHHIGKEVLEYKWTYTPQYKWIDKPSYVIIMDNFNEELQYLLNTLGCSEYDIPITNSTSKKKEQNITLSSENLNFLKKIYEKDFQYYQIYKSIPKEKRLPIKKISNNH